MITSTEPARASQSMLMKVPEITIMFWVAKLATTAFGEAFSDFVFFNDYIGQHPAILMGLGLLALALVIQFAQRRYRPVVYWFAVTAVSIFGTMSADFLNKDLGMPLWESTVMLLVLQAATFVAWFKTQGTLDVHSVNNRARESFYWLTVLFTFALGTAAGDFVSVTLGLGTFASAFVFLAVILLTAGAYKWAKLPEVVAFWFAYSLTRPLGASIADWIGVPAPYGDGIQLGTGVASAIFGAILIAAIAVVAVQHRRKISQPASPIAK